VLLLDGDEYNEADAEYERARIELRVSMCVRADTCVGGRVVLAPHALEDLFVQSVVWSLTAIRNEVERAPWMCRARLMCAQHTCRLCL
jgi:hypothetical protein